MSELKHPYQRFSTLVTFLTALTIVMIASIWMAAPYLLAVTIGGIFAILALPTFRSLTARGFWPKPVALLLTLGMILLIFTPISFFVSMAVQQIIFISRALADNELFSPQVVVARLSNWRLIEALGFSPESFSNQLHAWVQKGTDAGTALTVRLMTNLPEIALQLVLTSVSFYFLLLDGGRLIDWISDRIPFEKKVGKRVAESFKGTAIASIWATIASGLAQAVVLFFAYLALAVPGSFLAASATFLFAWIPLLGSGPVWIIAVVYLYVHGSVSSAIAMIVIGIAVGFLDNVVRPIVLKGRSHMHPLVSLVSSFGGLVLFGITGVFLGPILAAVTIALLQAWPEVAGRFGIMPKAY